MKVAAKTADSRYNLLLLNNSGVRRSVADGETTILEERSYVTVTLKESRSFRAYEGDASFVRNADGSYAVTIPAGGWFFGRF